MPRSMWNGTITFGHVAVPVKLYSAVQSQTVRFREVHLADAAKIEHRRFCSKEDREVPYEEVVKGHEVKKGSFVVVEDDELAAAAGPRSHVIELDAFVEAEEVDPVHLDRSYHLGAGDGGADAYRLLHDALERAGRAGLGRFTFHNREYLALVRPRGRHLALHTMRFADEIVGGDDVDVAAPGKAPSDREVEMAGKLVESLHERFDPSKRRDEYRDAVLAMLERKAAGETIQPPDEEEPEEQPDLTAALEASLSGGGGGRSRSSSRSGSRTKAKKG
jgi:DNA end-binding protein Ku